MEVNMLQHDCVSDVYEPEQLLLAGGIGFQRIVFREVLNGFLLSEWQG